MKTLVIGYGNLLRSDDGVGAYVADAVDSLKLPDTDVCTYHQLHVDLIEKWKFYDRIILVDASEKGPSLEIKDMGSDCKTAETASHHANPQALLNLLNALYATRPEVKLCSIRGKNFDFGNELSDPVKENAAEAVVRIKSLIQGNN